MFLKVISLHTLKITVIPADPKSPNSSWLLVQVSLNIHQTWQSTAPWTNMLMSLLAFNTFS